MRILITSIVDLKRVTHNRIHVFVDYLSRRHDVTVLCLNAWWLEKSEAKNWGADYHDDAYFRKMFERTRILYLSRGRVPPVLQEFTSLRTLNSILRKIDYGSLDVHVNYCNLIAGYFVARKAERLGIPTVFDVADNFSAAMRISPQIPYPVRPLAASVANTMLIMNTRIATRITFITKVLQDDYAHYLDKKSTIIPNGVDAQLFAASPPSQELRGKLGLRQDFVLGYVGVLKEWVDFEPVFEAIRGLGGQLSNIKLLALGAGARLRQNKELAKRYGISDNVVFAGSVPYTQVPRYISLMDVCLIPFNKSDMAAASSPIKLFEYMACERPVVSTPLPGVTEAVGDRVLYAQDSDELAARITELYYNEGLRHRMGVEGRRFVQENYSWAQICRRFEEVLVEATSQPAVDTFL